MRFHLKTERSFLHPQFQLQLLHKVQAASPILICKHKMHAILVCVCVCVCLCVCVSQLAIKQTHAH